MAGAGAVRGEWTLVRFARRRFALLAGGAVAALGAAAAGATSANGLAPASGATSTAAVSAATETGAAAVSGTTTPIEHLVVIFDENVSFDHYFATYPVAANPAGEPAFTAAAKTPAVDGLSASLLTDNGNLSNPMRLDRSDAMTCDQDHGYTAEQLAADHGAEDAYVQNTGNGLTLAQCLTEENKELAKPAPIPAGASGNDAVMDYYDGNTVTALWNYAQHFAMSDEAFDTTYGPSTPGALHVTSAQDFGALCGPSSATINDSSCTAPSGYDSSDVAASDITTGVSSVPAQPGPGGGTDYSDADPRFDICSYLPSSDGGDGDTPAQTIEMGGNNIGEELTKAGITWGWFEGGFDDGYVPGHGTAPTTAQVCSEHHQDVGGEQVTDYIPHHEPFQYYASTANPMHLPPTSVAMIGHTDRANHQYDIADFWAAADAGDLPAVSYLKAPAYEDGHAGYSDPLDEQHWLVNTVNRLEALPSWRSTAVVITWDDSDGWYDHVLGPLETASQTSLDALTAPGTCGPAKLVPTGSSPTTSTSTSSTSTTSTSSSSTTGSSSTSSTTTTAPATSSGTPEEGECGLGPRLPFLVLSPYARANSVSSAVIDQSSIVRFIEQNWRLRPLGNGAADASAGSLDSLFDWGAGPVNPPLVLSPGSGEPVAIRSSSGDKH
jgi:phospholipase C